ncbi:MAG TPA: YbaB/EbfC family nucleoid-associated protein [Cytophagaceae bacterium]|jgi:DNA-binding YbaB/EbfC family protein|nr:YbaB/EbfC family nucleoid-associated protein [Cytophagaceae bacterium]
MNMIDMFGMLGKAKEIQAKIQEFKDNAAKLTALGESGGGMVKVTMNGKKHLVKVEIEPSLFKPEEATILQDLIVAAANKAAMEIDVLMKEELKKQTEGVLPNIPGFDLASLIS